MGRTLLLAGLIFCLLAQFSCKGVKNVSGTLTKSGSTHRNYTKDGRTDYTKIPVESTQVKKDTVYPTQSAIVPAAAKSPLAQSTAQQATGDNYKKDYGRVSGAPTETSINASGANSTNADVNDKLVKQYAEMERLADLVLYELGIVERRWDQLLGKFKTASVSEREKISADLDPLSADQLKLYKAHVKIYKDGKADWQQTKKDVEATLFSVRGITEK